MPCEIGMREMPARPDQHTQLRRQCGQGHQPEPAVGFERFSCVGRGVLRVVAEAIVGHRQQHEQKEQWKPRHHVRMATARAEPRSGRHQRGHHEYEQEAEAFP
jgi:hypothetical protein